MARAIRPVHPADANRVRIALEMLAQVRELLKSAGCPAATKAVRHAMKSTEGAQRHVSHRINRAAASRGCWHYNGEAFCTQCDPDNY